MKSKVEISKSLVLKNSVSTVATTVINMTVLLWVNQYLLRRITTEEYSLYPVTAAVMVFLPLMTMILTGGVGRYVTEAYAKGDIRRITQIVSTMFPLLLGAGLIILVGGGFFCWHIDRILTITPGRLWDARIMMGLMILSFVIRIVTIPFYVGLYVRQKFVLRNLILLGSQLLRIAILFALLFGVSTRVVWVVVSSVSANLCGLFVILIISRRLVPALRFRFNEINWGLARVLTSFGAWNLVNEFAYMIHIGSAPIILNKLGTAIDVTCFYLGSLVIQAIGRVSGPIIAQMEPMLTAMHATEDTRLRNAYLRAGRYALWAVLLIALPVMLYSREIILLYVGQKYLVASTVIVLLLLRFPMLYGHVLLTRLASARAQVGLIARRMIIIELVNLGLCLYLVGILRLGALGPAISMAFVVVLLYPLFIWPLGFRLAELTFQRWFRETILPVLWPALAGAAVWAALKFMVRPTSWTSLGVCAAGGMICYVVVLLTFCLKDYERRELGVILSKFRDVTVGRFGRAG